MNKIKDIFQYAKNEKQAIEKLEQYKIMYFVHPLSRKEDKIIQNLFKKNLIDIEQSVHHYGIFHVKWVNK